MKKLGALLIILGTVLSGVGAYFWMTYQKVGEDIAWLKFGLETGMINSLSTSDGIRLWCIENHTMLIIAGLVVVVLGIICCVYAKTASEKAIVERSTNIANWMCPGCGTENRGSLGSCAECGAQKPSLDQIVYVSNPAQTNGESTTASHWLKTPQAWIIIALLAIRILFSVFLNWGLMIQQGTIMNAKGDELSWIDCLPNLLTACLTGICLCGALAFHQNKNKRNSILFAFAWFIAEIIYACYNIQQTFPGATIDTYLSHWSMIAQSISYPALLLILVFTRNKIVKICVIILFAVYQVYFILPAMQFHLARMNEFYIEEWFKTQSCFNLIGTISYSFAILIAYLSVRTKRFYQCKVMIGNL